MAASPIMDELGQLPTSRKVLLFVVAGLLLGALYHRFIYTSLAERTAEAQAVYEGSRRTHATGVRSLERYEALRPEMDALRSQLERDQAALPTEAEVPAFFETLEHKVKESGVEITKWTKRTEEPIESFVKVPVEIEITGTFMQIKRFFASLVEKHGHQERERLEREGPERERIVSIESLVISQPQVRNREIVLSAKLVAVTFRQEAKGAAPDKPGAAPAPSVPPPLRPSPAAPTPSPTPSPSSGAGSGSGRLQKGM